MDAASRLPTCDRAAKLHAALHRLADADDHRDATQAATNLVASSAAALKEDPWMQFHIAALRMAAALNLPRRGERAT
jgi:hypothetical protein